MKGSIKEKIHLMEVYGIGLSLSKSIIEENNGYLDAEIPERRRDEIYNKIF